ncbi:MAG: hypothetical protein ACRDKY_06570 [Solirubrobacteraceae bacterium]
MNATKAAAAAAVLCSLALAGCGSDDDGDKATGSTTTAPAAAGSPQLVGTYERRVTRADIRRTAKIRNEAGPNQEEPTPGPARLVITRSSLKVLDLAVDPPFAIEQSISATAGRLRVDRYVRPEKGSFCGPELPQNASYAWSIDGRVLRLRPVEDGCADRDSVLTGAWTRQP